MVYDDCDAMNAMVVAAKAGEALALNQLLVRTQPYVRQVVRSLLGNQRHNCIEIEDVTQESLMRVVRDLQDLNADTIQGFLSWVAVITRHTAYHAMEKVMADKRGWGWNREDYSNVRLRSSDPTPLECAIESEMRSRMRDALQPSSPRVRRAFELMETNGSIDDVSRDLGCTYAAAQSLVKRARRCAKEVMGEV